MTNLRNQLTRYFDALRKEAPENKYPTKEDIKDIPDKQLKKIEEQARKVAKG